jgi:methyl-accepting chemotaxis protein
MIAEANAAQARIVQLLGDGLARVAEKDLTFRLTDEVPPSYRRLQTDFNTAVGQLSEAIGEMAESTRLLGAGMQETVAAADDLSRRTESQASSLEETAAALAQITETVAQTAEDAENARRIVSNMSSEAEASGGIVRQAIGAMGDIEQSSKKIAQIIGVIDSIATQTNLLALNAGVEAARAGEAGRGFAVVAAEIRDLARRSAKAAKEIDILISVSNAQIGRGVSLVGDTGGALSRIVEEIARVNGVAAEIADRARQQAAALNEVNRAVGQMDMITQQNAAMAEQTTAVSHGLSEKTRALIALISRFRIADDARAAGPRLAASDGEVVAPVVPTRRASDIDRRVGASDRRARVWTDF